MRMIYSFLKKRSVKLYGYVENYYYYKVEIPEKIMGEKVRVESIGPSVFKGKLSVKEVYLPTSIRQIEGSAFSHCHNLERVIFADPSNLKIIGNCAFSYCESLKTIQIPDSVETIAYGAFNNSGLEKIIFTPNSKLTEICSYAFAGCKNLQSITIPKGVKELPRSIFSSCSRLEEIRFMKGSNLRIIKDMAIERCPKLKRLVLPNKYVQLESGAFLGSDIEELVMHPLMLYSFKNAYSEIKRVFSTEDGGLIYLES